MAIVVEDGSGKVDAVSYATVAETDAYFAVRGSPTAWTSASTTSKENALIAATDFLDRRWGRSYAGTRWTSTQRLAWPRSGVEIDGFTMEVAPLPRQIREAVAEAALRFLQDGALIPDLATPGLVVEEEVAVGELSTRTKWSGGKGQSKGYPVIAATLGDLIASADFAERG